MEQLHYKSPLKSPNLQGEIITPAFGWIATVNAIVAENCKPVFCDIDKDTLNIDVFKIEKLITKNSCNYAGSYFWKSM